MLGCTSTAGVDPGYVISLETQPSPMQTGGVATVLVRVQQPDGAPLSGAKVVFRPEHTSMSKGKPTTITTLERDSGVYAAEYLPPMSGKYRVTVDVDGPKGKGEKAFDAEVR